METIGKIATVLVALVTASIVRGLVLVALWGWYVEQLGVPSINIAEAIGLAMLVGMLVQSQAEDPKKDKRPFMEKFFTNFTVSIFGAGFVYLFGWIVHFFV